MPSAATATFSSSSRAAPIGGAGTHLFAGIIDDSFDKNTEARGDKWYGSILHEGVSQQMLRTDAHVRKSVESLIDPILGAQWDFVPASSSPRDAEVADFCRLAFFECIDWQRALRHALGYICDGFAFLELTDAARPLNRQRFPRHRGRGTAILPTGMHHRPASTVQYWHQSESNPAQLDAITQYLHGSDTEETTFLRVPANRLIRFSWQQDGANFAGFAPLRSAFGPWKVKRVLTVLESIRHERGIGIPVMSLPEEAPTDSELDKADQILANLRGHDSGYLTLPHGYGFGWEELQGQGSGISQTIERCNRDIAHNLGVSWLLLGSNDKTGSYALAGTQQSAFHSSIEKHARFIEACFNHGQDGWSPVERLVRLNYGDNVAIPRLKARHLPTRDYTVVLPLVHNLTMSGHITPDEVTEDFIREVTYLPPRDPKTERKKAEAPAPEPEAEPEQPEPQQESDSDPEAD